MSPNAAELGEALEQVLAPHIAPGVPIIRWQRHPSGCRSSFPLDEIHVSLGDGTSLELIFKDLNRQSLSESVRRAKPAFVHDPLREIEMYRTVLASSRLGTAVCYGISVDEGTNRYWLFLERVRGEELYQIGKFPVWKQTARWLAGMHTRLSAELERMAPPWREHLLRYDGAYYRLWIERALEFSRQRNVLEPNGDWERMEWLAGRYGQVIDRLLALPATLVHGEFYASNVLVEEIADDVRVCPVDWEMAALAPRLMDLAALTAGRWTDEERRELEDSYYLALEQDAGTPLERDAFLAELDCCRLHQAVQWLGWSSDWSPPREQAQDWLGEAMRLAARLGL